MPSVITVSKVSKTYASGFRALDEVDLEIRRGEIFALLGPNGAGKTTLISVICGIVTPTSGQVRVDGHDIISDYRAARSMVGLVPQELTTDAFESVLKSLSLWDKKDNKIMTLSGGMKRRLLIAKALSHEPRVLFLDEPTAGVDVRLRRDMWELVRSLRATGVTIILTTHYIDEAQEMADRIGVISKGRIILVEDKVELMRKLGKKQLSLTLEKPLAEVPTRLATYGLELASDGTQLVYSYDAADASADGTHPGARRADLVALLRDVEGAGIEIKDLHTTQRSLEDIFVDLVRDH